MQIDVLINENINYINKVISDLEEKGVKATVKNKLVCLDIYPSFKTLKQIANFYRINNTYSYNEIIKTIYTRINNALTETVYSITDFIDITIDELTMYCSDDNKKHYVATFKLDTDTEKNIIVSPCLINLLNKQQWKVQELYDYMDNLVVNKLNR